MLSPAYSQRKKKSYAERFLFFDVRWKLSVVLWKTFTLKICLTKQGYVRRTKFFYAMYKQGFMRFNLSGLKNLVELQTS